MATGGQPTTDPRKYYDEFEAMPWGTFYNEALAVAEFNGQGYVGKAYIGRLPRELPARSRRQYLMALSDVAERHGAYLLCSEVGLLRAVFNLNIDDRYTVYPHRSLRFDDCDAEFFLTLMDEAA